MCHENSSQSKSTTIENKYTGVQSLEVNFVASGKRNIRLFENHISSFAKILSCKSNKNWKKLDWTI